MADTNFLNEEPLYNIGVVARMTSISMATLRAWERRYNFPSSERTAGGHRLYSERDVMQLRWVKARIDEGMQTAQAINALRHQESTGHLVLTASAAAPVQAVAGEKYAPASAVREYKPLEGGNFLDIYFERTREALLRRDVQAADEAIGEALAVSSPEELILRVLSPSLASFGDDWEAGRINAGTEHYATNYLRQRLLTWMVSGPPPRSVRPIVMACAPEEWHEGSLLVLGALLRRRRWPVAYLGQSLPLHDLASFVGDIQPRLVVLVAMTEATAANLAEWPQWLPAAAKQSNPLIGYGGRVFMVNPEWRLKVPGIYLGNTFEDGLATIERLLAEAH